MQQDILGLGAADLVELTGCPKSEVDDCLEPEVALAAAAALRDGY